MRSVILLLLVLALSSCTEGAPTPVSVSGIDTIREAAEEGERALGVPADLVLAVAWSETRWQQPEIEEGHAHVAPTIGVAGLRDFLEGDPLSRAEARVGIDRTEAANDPARSILLASAMLAELARDRSGGALPPADEPGVWREAVADYVGLTGDMAREAHADSVMAILRRGVEGDAADGSHVLLRGRDVWMPEVAVALGASADYGPAHWSAASTSNYSDGRGGNTIRYVIIHTMQGSYSGSISWFRNPAASVSAHYCIRSVDGDVTQMVDDSDTGWHAGNFTYNQRSIGIEHEGFVADPGRWYTEAMYASSAALTRHLTTRYGIPRDRAHIFGHVEVPGATHTDPGSGWNWSHYMDLVGGAPARPAFDATFAGQSIPTDMNEGERAVAFIEMNNTGSGGWDIDGTRLGTWPDDHASPLYDVANWMNDHRASGADHDYAASTLGRFTFMVHAPDVDADTTITETFRLVQEGVTWFGPEVTISIRVHAIAAADPDADGDGAPASADCDDGTASVHPGAAEVCGDGVDQDCSGADTECASASDAGVPPMVRDAGGSIPSDGSTARDGGSTRRDAASTSGGGAPRPTASGCSISPGRTNGPSILAAALFAVAIVSRRRRR
jgi:N-acetyl-anhydromuramyl-L-alanine amidase AmpD